MGNDDFDARLGALRDGQERLLARRNEAVAPGNGIYSRWRYPVITPGHVPLHWRYDLDPADNPFLMERIGVNATFNAGAILHRERFTLVVRVEGVDRKSWFAVAESESGTDGFRFRPRPIAMPELDSPDTNIYDMRLTEHEDGYIYGLFCTERKDESNPGDTSAAIAACGIARTTDLDHWERLPDLVTNSAQQRNCVLHPEFVDGRYAIYTRPQDGFVGVGNGGGIGWGLTDSMENAVVADETIVDPKVYHTVSELKNGQGPAPLRTDEGWLHLAHGVRETAAGLRYVLYMFMTDRDEPWKVTRRPAGHLIAPRGAERVGDVSNVVFSGGWIRDTGGTVYIYYASSDTRLHVATTSVDRLLDYCRKTPADSRRSAGSVAAVNALIDKNASCKRGQ